MSRLLRSRSFLLLIVGVGLWLAAVVVASAKGWLSSLSPFAPPIVAGSTTLVLSVLYFTVPSFRRLIERVGLRRLTAIHILRIAAVPVFFWYGARGLLPQVFVDRAGWGDLTAGLLALVVVLFWRRPVGYWAMHLYGMADFFIAFGTAMGLTRVTPTAVHAVTGLPMALIPFFGVAFLATTHIMGYDLLLRGHGAEQPAKGNDPTSSTLRPVSTQN